MRFENREPKTIAGSICDPRRERRGPRQSKIENREPKIEMIPVRASNLVTREVAGEVVLIPVRNDAARLDAFLFLLENEVAVRAWQLIDGVRSATEIREHLLNEFEVEPETLDQDLEAYLGQLAQIGAIAGDRLERNDDLRSSEVSGADHDTRESEIGNRKPPGVVS